MEKNVTCIGLYDIVEENIPEENRPLTTYCDLALTTDYDRVVDRLIGNANVSGCNEGTIILGVKALWDTGSRTSAVSRKIAERLKLQPVDTMWAITPTKPIEVPVYYVDIQLAEEMTFKRIKVTEYPLENHDVDLLIGMDIIKQGKFTTYTKDDKTVFEFEMK